MSGSEKPKRKSWWTRLKQKRAEREHTRAFDAGYRYAAVELLRGGAVPDLYENPSALADRRNISFDAGMAQALDDMTEIKGELYLQGVTEAQNRIAEMDEDPEENDVSRAMRDHLAGETHSTIQTNMRGTITGRFPSRAEIQSSESSWASLCAETYNLCESRDNGDPPMVFLGFPIAIECNLVDREVVIHLLNLTDYSMSISRERVEENGIKSISQLLGHTVRLGMWSEVDELWLSKNGPKVSDVDAPRILKVRKLT